MSHPDLLTIEQSVLVIVDMQSKLTAAMPAPDAQLMSANTLKLLASAERVGVPVIVSEQYPKGLGSTAPDISSALPPDTVVFSKTSFSCWAVPEFKDFLQALGRRQVILVGQEAHVCVLQSALDLLFAGFQVYVVVDALCSRQSAHKNYALQRMQQQGVSVLSYESVLFEWLRDAGHANFKMISGLVR